MKNTSPRIYVGTYGKYNSGSIAGQWLDLADYNTYDELMKACSYIDKRWDDQITLTKRTINTIKKQVAELSDETEVF